MLPTPPEKLPTSRRRIAATVVVVAVAVVSAGCVRPLGTPDDLHLAYAVDVNDSGMIVGSGEGQMAVLDGPDGAVTWVAAPAGQRAEPKAVNASGVVVGQVVTGSGRTQSYTPFRWTRQAGIQLLPLPAGTAQAAAFDVNDRGRVLVNAYSPTPNEADGAYLWDPAAATYRRLADLPTGVPASTAAWAVNNAGMAVGYSGRGSPDHALVFWDAAGTIHKLPVDGLAGAAVDDINDRGTVVGTMTLTSGGEPHAVAWTGPDHAVVDLGPGSAVAVNDHDVAVGQSAGPGFQGNLWIIGTGRGVALGGSDAVATAVNDRGLVVGHSDGQAVRFT